MRSPAMPISNAPSRPVSGSITRPPRMTRSKRSGAPAAEAATIKASASSKGMRLLPIGSAAEHIAALKAERAFVLRGFR